MSTVFFKRSASFVKHFAPWLMPWFGNNPRGRRTRRTVAKWVDGWPSPDARTQFASGFPVTQISGRDPGALIHTSAVLQRLQDEATADHFTLGWLVVHLRKRSYGMLMLMLALFAIVPGVSSVAGLLLMIPAFQMIAGRSAPTFPRRLAVRPLSTRHLATVVRQAVPVLRYLEKMVHPRWHTLLEATKRFVGAVVVMLSVVLVFAPIPLGNVLPAVVIALISLAYLEEDGLLLSVALVAAVIVLTFMLVAVWEAVLGVKWVIGLW